jgi:hypothetical protein
VLVHVKTDVSVTLGRLDGDGNVRQPTEFKFVISDHSDATFLELAALVRKQRAELAGSLEEGR